VVAIVVQEFRLCVVGLVLLVTRANENLRHVEHRYDCSHFVCAAVLFCSGKHAFGHDWVQWQV
jgi:hypothetical protein